MATAEEGGATANTTSSSYGGGGAGGKFRKKPFRRQTTPYDRPPTTLRGNNNTTSSWLTKLVVDPASKLISYGAERFFASLFRKRLPPPPQTPESNTGLNDGVQGAVLSNIVGADLKNVGGVDLKNIDGVDLKKDNFLQCQGGVEEPAAADFSKPANGSSNNAISELEQLLKLKKFTRSEIVHLTELLQSRAVEVSLGDDRQKNEEMASDFGRHQPFASRPLEEKRNEGIMSSAALTTPIADSKVPEEDIATPADLAKAYMGNRPSKVSPSALGLRGQVGREDTGLLNNIPFASESPSMSLTKKTPLGLAAPNGFITPRSRGRSAIYNMARTPYSRVHPTSNLKGGAINSNGYAGPSMSSSYLSLVENNENFESQPMTLKRRSSVFDDEVGSVGPIRRIRQKSNLLAPKIHHSAHGVGIGSQAKQKLQLIGEPRFKVSKTTRENENESIPSTSYAHVPSKSSEVAARIFQHLDKLSPKEKPSESKLVTIREKSKSPSKSSPTMLSGKAFRSMEDVDSSKLLLDVQNDHKSGYSLNATLSDAHDSSSQKQGKVEDNGPKESFVLSDTWNPVMKNDSAVSFKGFGPSSRAIDSTVKDGASQPPQKKRAFRMSAQEDYLEQDDDVHCNGLASRPFSEKKGLMEGPPTDSKLLPSEVPKLVKTTVQPEERTPLGLISRKTSEPSCSGAVTVGEGGSIASSRKPEEATAASQSVVLPLSAAAFDKPKEANNPPPSFSFSSKIADKFPSLPSESSKMAESQPGSSNSLFNVFPSTGSQAKIPELDTSSQVNPPKAGDTNAKSDIVPSAASNGPPVSSPPPVSFTSASSNSTNFGIANFGSSTSSIFGLTTKPSTAAGPTFNFGSSLVPSSAVSAAPTEVADQRTKPKTDPSSGTSKLGSFFASASKSQESSTGITSQGTSVQSSSSASLPSFNINGSSPFGSLNSQLFNPNTAFGFSSSASSSDATAVVPSTGPTSNAFKFGSSSSALPESTTPATFGFGFNSSSSSTNTVGSSTSAMPTFNFGANASASVINTASSLSSGSSSTFGFGANSSTSSTNAVGSSTSATPTFNFGANSSASASLINTAGSLTSGSSSTLAFGLNPSSSSTTNSNSSNTTPSNVFGSGIQTQKSPIFGSSFTSPSPSTGFAFGASSSSSSTSFYSFTSANASVSASPNLSQPTFGNTGFAASPGNNDQMNTEDSMAEDPVHSAAAASASVPNFGQSAVATSPGGFAFGSTAPAQTNPFMFGGQQSQLAPPQNPSSFQASGSFNAGGSFSLGSGGGDKSGRKIVKISRNKNRKK